MDNPAFSSASALSPGYVLDGYTIREVLGKGGFGITYLAVDNRLDRQVAIKEYLPVSFAHRGADDSISPINEDQDANFSWGLNNFLKEARTLAQFNHQNIVRVHTVFESNNSAYMVMEYESGNDLASLIKGGEKFDQQKLQRLFFPIIDGLGRIHDLGFIHRDVKPANIYIRTDGTPVLIDFGSARQTSQQTDTEFTALVSQGYTPLEQYSADYGNQGPWTDLYSMAATMYHCITGSKPDDTLSRSACALRSQPDRVQSLHAQQYPGFEQHFLDAVIRGLQLSPEQRPQSLIDWLNMFEKRAATSPTAYSPNDRHQSAYTDDETVFLSQGTAPSRSFEQADPNRPDTHRTETETERSATTPHRHNKEVSGSNKQGKSGLIVGAIVVAAAFIGGAYYYVSAPQAPSQAAENATTAITERPSPAESTVASTETTDNTTSEKPTAVAPEMPDISPPTATLSENIPGKSIVFDQPLTNDQHQPPRSIAELMKTTPDTPPIPGLNESMWKDQTCSNCHSWTRDTLCTQGEFYVSNGSQAITRIAHPFNGLFKGALRDWAENSCL